MNEAIETRELITLDGLGVLFRGTYHKPRNRSAHAKEVSTGRNRTGVVFLNSLSIPRAATGDSAVYWADAFAECGYPSFRFDLPGLGDTFGEIPNELLDFINDQGYASITAAKMKELALRYDLSGVVIVAHCAGGVTAISAAASCAECTGLVLMDPYFHLTKAIRPKVRQELSDWARRSKVGAVCSNIYDLVRKARLSLRRNSPPGNANFALLARWKQVASTGLPILIIKAPSLKASGTKARAGEFDYLKHVLDTAGRKKQVTVEFIEDTDHSFANRLGRARVRERVTSWLEACFPQENSHEVPANPLHWKAHEAKEVYKNHDRRVTARAVLES
jgi:alpha-beta hydrolase superfamily lysophospholipase